MASRLLVLAVASSNVAFADVWVAGEKALYKLDAAGNQVTLTIASSRSRSLAVDPNDASLWVLGETSLSKLSSSGSILVQLDLKDFGLNDARHLALDSRDGSIWVGRSHRLSKDGGGNPATILHLDGAGRAVGSVQAPEGVVAIAVALDQSVWILGQKSLLHYTAAGSPLATIDTKSLVDGEPKLLEVDSIGAWVWIEAERRIVRIDAQSPSGASISIPLPAESDLAALDPIIGTIWISSEKQLLSVNSAGTIEKSLQLKSLRIDEPKALAFDPITRSILLGHDRGVVRLSQSGDSQVLIAIPEGVSVIGVSPLTLETLVTVAEPRDGFVTNKAFLPVILQLKALCSGSDCGFRGGFFHGYKILALLNGQQVGSSFAIDPSTGVATYQPSTRYPEGVNSISASAVDSFGRVSMPASSAFTVDTIPPSFLALTPLSPLLTNQRIVRISGRLSETSILTIGAAYVPAATDNAFSYDQALVEGGNTIALVATDLAGNSASQALTVTLDTIPPRFVALTPVDGAVVGTADVAVTGIIDEAGTIAISGRGPAQSAQGTDFRFPVTLAPGPNALLLTATDKAGNSSQRAITITYVPVTLTVTAPGDGSSVMTDAVQVTGTFTGPPGTRVLVNGQDAGLAVDTFTANVPLAPGTNTITVSAVSPDEVSVSASLQVVRNASAPSPVITFYSPNDGDTFAAPATIYVKAGAVNPDGTPSSSVTISNDSPAGFSAGVGETDFAEYYWLDVPEGTYTLWAQVSDGNGGTAAKSITITVLPDPVDAPFIQAWNAMNDALRTGDRDRALSYLNDGAKAKYGPVFDALAGHWQQIIDSYSPLTKISLGDDLAEFAVGRDDGGITRIFFIYFLKNPDGSWLIDSM